MKNIKKFELFSKGESSNWKFKIGDYVRIKDMNYIWISDDREFPNNQIFKIVDTGDNNCEMEDQYVLYPVNNDMLTIYYKDYESVVLANDPGIEFLTDEEIAVYKYNI